MPEWSKLNQYPVWHDKKNKPQRELQGREKTWSIKSVWLGRMSLKNHIFSGFIFCGYSWVLIEAVVTLYNRKQQ